MKRNHQVRTDPTTSTPSGQATAKSAHSAGNHQNTDTGACPNGLASEEYELRTMKLENEINFHLFVSLRCGEDGNISDAQFLDFLCMVVANNSGALRHLAAECLNPNDRASVRECLLLDTVVTAAEAVNRRARYYGFSHTPTDVEWRNGQRRQPLLLDLPGVAGLFEYQDCDLLFHIADSLFNWRDKIRSSILPHLIGRQAAELSEVLSLAEAFVDRDCGDLDEVEASERDGTLTELQRETLTYKLKSRTIPISAVDSAAAA